MVRQEGLIPVANRRRIWKAYDPLIEMCRRRIRAEQLREACEQGNHGKTEFQSFLVAEAHCRYLPVISRDCPQKMRGGSQSTLCLV